MKSSNYLKTLTPKTPAPEATCNYLILKDNLKPRKLPLKGKGEARFRVLASPSFILWGRRQDNI